MDKLLKILRQHPRADWQWTLDPGIGAWSRDNALALGNCALLAYSDPDDIDAQLRARSFERVIHCNPAAPGADTQGYVAVRPDAVVLAFRGTEPTKWKDIRTDIQAAQTPFANAFGPEGWGVMHAGWAEGFEVVRAQVQQALAQVTNRPLWITGHSLGGALALVAAAFLAGQPAPRIAGVYTFGQPRVGDPDFCARYDAILGGITFRCVNDRDPVPHLPPRELGVPAAAVVGGGPAPVHYRHAGQFRWLRPDGGLSSDQETWEAGESDALARAQTLGGALLGAAILAAEATGPLTDHWPVNPVTHQGYVDRIEALR